MPTEVSAGVQHFVNHHEVNCKLYLTVPTAGKAAEAVQAALREHLLGADLTVPPREIGTVQIGVATSVEIG